jgi:hypothetical protein
MMKPVGIKLLILPDITGLRSTHALTNGYTNAVSDKQTRRTERLPGKSEWGDQGAGNMFFIT